MNLFKRVQSVFKKVWTRIRGKRYTKPSEKLKIMTQEEVKKADAAAKNILFAPEKSEKIKKDAVKEDTDFAKEGLEFSEAFYQHLKNINYFDIDENTVNLLFSSGRINLGKKSKKTNKSSLYIDVNPAFYNLFLDIKDKLKNSDEISEDVNELSKRLYETINDFKNTGFYAYSDEEIEFSIIGAEKLLNSIAKNLGLQIIHTDRRQRYEA